MLNIPQEKSAKDAAAVKVLTIIGLVYLPTTLVAVCSRVLQDWEPADNVQNFFSTQFVQTNSNGEMQVSRNVWLLAVIAIPLTAVTVAAWWLWVYARFSKLLNLTKYPKFPARRVKMLRSLVSASGKQQLVDPESGVGGAWPDGGVDQQIHHVDTSPETLCPSGATTWSTVVSSGKKGHK
jgi:hypothetical protein